MEDVTNYLSVPVGGTSLRPPTQPSSARAWWGAGLAVAAVGWGAQQFAPLLLLYQAQLGLSTTVVQATFGVYVFGLIPGLLLGGPVSDRYGRRRVLVPTLVASLLGSGLLILGGDGTGWLVAGRLVAGAASGAAFSSGAAWIKELSTAGSGAGSPPGSGAGANPGPRRLTVAIPLAMRTPETRPARRSAPLGVGAHRPSAGLSRRFWTVVVPLAPWVFGSASIALAYLPGLVRAQLGGHALIFSAVVTLLTAAAGIVVQPLARRLDRAAGTRLLASALAIVVVGLLVAVAASAWLSPALVVLAALVLGAGYGCCQVCGLLEVQRLAPPEHLAGLTALYQAVSYLGFLASFLLAAAGRLLPPGELLAAVAGLAVLTLVWTTWFASAGSFWKVRR